MRITVIGAGYVGLVTGACLAELGHSVSCLDINEEKVALIQSGTIPIYEPGLSEMTDRNTAAGRLSFATDCSHVVPGSDVVIIAVGTPLGVKWRRGSCCRESSARIVVSTS